MTNDLDTLLTALYVKVDDELEAGRWMGRPPQLADAELITLAVAQALLGFHSETRWLRYAHTHLAAMFPYLPQQSGYNKRLKAALPLVKKAIRMLAVDTDFWFGTTGSSTRHQCRVGCPGRQRNVRRWRAGPDMGIARPTPGSSGAYACTWFARRLAYRSCGPFLETERG